MFAPNFSIYFFVIFFQFCSSFLYHFLPIFLSIGLSFSPNSSHQCFIIFLLSSALSVLLSLALSLPPYSTLHSFIISSLFSSPSLYPLLPTLITSSHFLILFSSCSPSCHFPAAANSGFSRWFRAIHNVIPPISLPLAAGGEAHTRLRLIRLKDAAGECILIDCGVELCKI